MTLSIENDRKNEEMTGTRDFVKQLATTETAMFILSSCLQASQFGSRGQLQSYLAGQAALFSKDLHAAALSRFSKADFGLFMHYGLYSVLGRGEWVRLHEKIPVTAYERLKMKFTARNFDSDFITDLAIAAGMKYVNRTAKHHEGFCLFKTGQTDYNSLNFPARRDLVGGLKNV
jgi:alpha-L-fucosidase